MRMKFLGLVIFGFAGVALAQAPAGAPAGTNGICKDGTYSQSASKSGACRGHQGVQTWYVASAPKTAAAPAAAPAPAAKPAPAMPAPTPSAPVASRPAPTPAAPASAPAAPAPSAAAAAPAKKLSPAEAAAQKPQAAGGGPGLVWVNTASNVYHCNGDAYYGKTKAGKYMTEDQAKAAGAHGDRGASCAGK